MLFTYTRAQIVNGPYDPQSISPIDDLHLDSFQKLYVYASKNEILTNPVIALNNNLFILRFTVYDSFWDLLRVGVKIKNI